MDLLELIDANSVQQLLGLVRGVKDVCSPLIEICANIKRLIDKGQDDLPFDSLSSYIDRTYEEAVTCRAECARVVPLLSNNLLRSITTGSSSTSSSTSSSSSMSSSSVQSLLGMNNVCNGVIQKQYNDCESMFIVYEPSPIQDEVSESEFGVLQSQIERLKQQLSQSENEKVAQKAQTDELERSLSELKQTNEELMKANKDFKAASAQEEGLAHQLQELQCDYDEMKETLCETQKECHRLKRELELWDSKEKELERLRLIMRFSQLKRDSDQLHVFKTKVTELGIPCDILDPIDIFNDGKPKTPARRFTIDSTTSIPSSSLNFMRPVDGRSSTTTGPDPCTLR